MRRTLAVTTIAVVASTIALAQPADARPLTEGHRDRSVAKKIDCQTAVFGVDSTGHLSYDELHNAKVKSSSRAKKKLPFDVTAVGFYDFVGNTLRLDTVTSSGTPRQVVATVTDKGAIAYKSNKKYDQDNYAPGLFADSNGYYAYTVERGKLLRWTLTLYRDKSIKFAQKVVLGKGFKDLTSLQAGGIYTVKGAQREFLYATTADGSLVQIVVPLKKPGSYKLKTLADTGYAGVTELSWTACNKTGDFHSLIAIDGEAATATWTTIRNAFGRPDAELQGPVSGGKGWDLVGAI